MSVHEVLVWPGGDIAGMKEVEAKHRMLDF